MKKIFLLSLLLEALFITSYAQLATSPVFQKGNFRMAGNSIVKPLKAYAFFGTDSTDLTYSYTIYYQYDTKGNTIKSLAIDTINKTYYGTNFKSYDAFNKIIFEAQVDTVANDTSLAVETSYRNDGFVITTQEGLKVVRLDSAGRTIIDSIFNWEDDAWKFKQVQRDYSINSGGKFTGILTTVSSYSSQELSLSRILYQYEDTLIVSSVGERFNREIGQWEKTDSTKIDYVDDNKTANYKYYNAAGELTFYFQYKYDALGNLVQYTSPDRYVLYTFNSINEWIQFDYHLLDTVAKTSRHNRILYSDFKNVAVTGVKNSIGKESELRVFPNPTRAILNIDLVNKSLKIKALSVKNNLGQIVYVSEGRDSIDLEILTAGVYYLEIQTSLGIVHKTIIKE